MCDIVIQSSIQRVEISYGSNSFLVKWKPAISNIRHQNIKIRATYQRGKPKFSGWKENALFIDVGKTLARNEDGGGEPNAAPDA